MSKRKTKLNKKPWLEPDYHGEYPPSECGCGDGEWSWTYNNDGIDFYECLGCGKSVEIDRNPPKKVREPKPASAPKQPDPEPEPEEKITAFFPKNKKERSMAGAIFIDAEGFCEHCMELEPFDACISDGGTHFCVNCFECDDNNVIPPDVMKEIVRRQKELKKKYYAKKLKEQK